ncbi:hypothetical protein LCGC14_2125340, partial [marine sediment metagenome]
VDNYTQVKVAAENSKKARMAIEGDAARAIVLRELIETCVAAGGDPVRCMESAHKLPSAKDYKALNPDHWKGAKPGRSWLWWLGLGVVLVTVGGVTYYVFTRRRPAAPQSVSRQLPAPRRQDGWTY